MENKHIHYKIVHPVTNEIIKQGEGVGFVDETSKLEDIRIVIRPFNSLNTIRVLGSAIVIIEEEDED